jgi:arylsulfatase A-like enzyme
MMSRRPNVILFISHDTGRYLSPYGVTTVRTPTAERLAREGVTFEQAFCTTPLCSPARASCVTGLYPHRHGVNGLTGDRLGHFQFHDGVKHAARLFRDGGYESILCGFEHEARHWENLGFDRAISGPGGWYNGGGDLREHPEELDAYLNQRDENQPFFMQVGCRETHRGWLKDGVEPDDELGVTVPPYLKDIPEVRRDLAEFQGAIGRLEHEVGRMLDVLDKHKLAEDTIFIYTTDHGIDMPRAKGTCYDSGLETFLFARWPGKWPAGRRIERQVSQIDLVPTLLSACGLSVPDGLDGLDLSGWLSGQAGPPQRQDIFGEKTYHDTYDPVRCVRTEHFKYIRYFEVNIFHDLRLATMDQRDWFAGPSRRGGVEELYDLHADPHEQFNLLKEEGHEETAADMRRRLAQWMRDSDDPLLHGPMSSPFYDEQRVEFGKLV